MEIKKELGRLGIWNAILNAVARVSLIEKRYLSQS